MRTLLTKFISIVLLCIFVVYACSENNTANNTTSSSQTVIIEPYLQLSTSNSIIIRWRTQENSKSIVKYGTTLGNYVFTATGNASKEHIVKISGLLENTQYYYMVGSSDDNMIGENDSSYTFRTHPAIGSKIPVRIWALGDSGTADVNAARVRDAYIAYNTDRNTNVWLMLGDNAYSRGTDQQYRKAVFELFYRQLRQLSLWPTLGNHDGVSADSITQSGVYYDIFSLPTNAEAGGVPSNTEAYYSFDYANVHFVCLESNETDRSHGGAMLTWLKSDLAVTTQDWIIAYWHHPPYTKGSHDSDTETNLIEMRENVLPILESYGVDLVLTGHSHSYERSYLVDGHYGLSNTFNPSIMLLDSGDGKVDSDGAYTKAIGNGTPNEGAVYVVAGNSGKIDGGSFDHPVMNVSTSKLGSLVIDVYGNRMDLTVIDDNSVAYDYFTLKKGSDTLPPTVINVLPQNNTQLLVIFSEPVNSTSAINLSNYSANNGLTIISASISSNNKEVTLSTSQIQNGISYQLTINNIQDIDGNTMTQAESITFGL